MRPRTLLLFAFVALLGALAVVPQAFAAPSALKLEVAQNCHLGNWPCWNPEGNPEANVPENEVPPFKLAQGGTISFEDKDAEAATDVIWKGTARPGCTGVVEMPPVETDWSGTCTFSEPGTYRFESEELFKETGPYTKIDYTKYEIVVTGTPTDGTTSASGETQTEAMLNGSIDPKGNTVEYHFEYEGPGVIGKPSTPTATLSAADFTSHPVSAQVTGLLPDTTYHFLLVATYGAGKAVAGATTETFTTHTVTAPTATTLAAEGVKETEAILKATVNQGGEATEYFFEYGTDTHYGQKTGKATLLASGGNKSVSATLKGLTPGTEYHFRLVAENKQGPSDGLDRSFKTTAPAAKEPNEGPAAKEPAPSPIQAPAPGPILPEPEIAPLVRPLVGSVKLTAPRHGSSVRASVEVSKSGAGGRLEIDLIADSASLAQARHRKSTPTVVGRLVRSPVSAGKVSFSVSLTARARSALRRHHRLALTVKITLTPTRGAAVTVTRGVVLRA